MQDLRTTAWPVPYSGTLRPGSVSEDRGLGEHADHSVLAQVSNGAEICPAMLEATCLRHMKTVDCRELQ